MAAEVYPDSTGASDKVSYLYNRQGQATSMVDQRGTTHVYVYDALGRQTADYVSVLGSGVDGAVRLMGQTYDVRGLAAKTTSYADGAGAPHAAAALSAQASPSGSRSAASILRYIAK